MYLVGKAAGTEGQVSERKLEGRQGWKGVGEGPRSGLGNRLRLGCQSCSRPESVIDTEDSHSHSPGSATLFTSWSLAREEGGDWQ